MTEYKNLKELQKMITLMRDQEKGCPIIKEHSHQSLALFMVEEALEAADCLKKDNPEDLKKELFQLLVG